MDLGMGELIVIFLVVLILFGGNKLPALGKGLGEALRGFREGMKDEPPQQKQLPPEGTAGERKA